VIESVRDSRAPTPYQLDDATCRRGFQMDASVVGQMSLQRRQNAKRLFGATHGGNAM
jgi:hypothetical protein